MMANDETDFVIDAKNISKKFCRHLGRSMMYGMQDIFREMTGRNRNTTLRKDEFLALNGVTFKLKRGDCLGIIGANGSGKSTLLKLLTGIIKPDAGRIEIRGKVSSIIELGAGFNPVLTGEENAMTGCQIVGLSRKESLARLDGIFRFAELEEFRNTPVSFYSSGMKVRLGFAVASQVDPDILILDEVLAVGDARFKMRCYEYIGKLINRTSVILVSHSLPNIIRLCNRVLLLRRGQMEMFDDPIRAVDAYMQAEEEDFSVAAIRHDTCNASITRVRINGEEDTSVIKTGGKMEIGFRVDFRESANSCVVSLNIITRDKVPLAFAISDEGQFISENGYLEGSFCIEHLPLSPGRYTMSLSVFSADGRELLAWHRDIMPFQVEGRDLRRAPVTLPGYWAQR